MIEIIEENNGDKLITLPNIDKRMAEEIMITYAKRGWFVDNKEELIQDIYFSSKSHVDIQFRLPKSIQNLKSH